MKKALISLAIVAVAMLATALQVSMSWDKSPENIVAGYKLYYTIVSSNTTPTNFVYYDVYRSKLTTNLYFTNTFANKLTIWGNTNTSATISNLLPDSTYAAAVTAFSTYASNESSYSSQILYTTPLLYTNGGTRPTLRLSGLSYATNWYNPPRVYTKTNGAKTTNYYSISPSTWRLTDNMFILTNWEVQFTTNLSTTNWSRYASGSNSTINSVITNKGEKTFFRIKIP